MKRIVSIVCALLMAAALLVAPASVQTARSAPIGNNILQRAYQIETGAARRAPGQQLVSSGAVYALLEATGELARRAQAAAALQKSGAASTPQTFFPYTNGNIRVNQDFSLRRQAEEVVAVNPTNPNNIIAGQNDSRVGFNKCGYDFSFDGGKTWGDQLPPFYQFVNQDGVTFDACSDPTATFDSRGNAYIAGVLFEINYADSAFVVAKSNAGIGGAFYHSPAQIPFQTFSDVPLGVVANDNDPNIFNDKEFIVADASKVSPKRDNVYATWTRFNGATGAGVTANSPIYFSQSTDGGATWSPGVEISGANTTYCIAFSGEANPNACDQDQGSHPIVGKDGTIYVAFGNGNTPTVGINQHMIVSCPPSADCSQSSSWTAPVKMADDYGTQPTGPDPVTGCSAGRQCLPPNGYRLDDFTQGSISVSSSGKLFSVWADFRNGQANCGQPNGNAATSTPPCDNDVFYNYSTDGGATWSNPRKLTPRGSAQWMPWSAVSPDGRTLWVAYYDRKYGTCEMTGCNDITLARIQNPASRWATVSNQRLTTSSMPNLVPANNPVQAGFLGDYMWVTVDIYGNPYVVWADTRGQHHTVEEDVYFWKGSIEH